MASVINDPDNRKRVVFKGLDDKRRSIRLGKMARRDADSIARHVDAILVAELSRSPLAASTAEWLGAIPDAMHKKLAAVGLVHARGTVAAPTLGPFLDTYLARRDDAKASTRVFYGHTARNLKEFFTDRRLLETINPAEADDFRRWLVTSEKLAPATVARRCSLARTFFRDAVRRRLIESNPFEGVGGGPKNNPERSRFIDKETVAKVIDACPNAEWRCLVALSRFAGLRVPSEALLLKWEDIHWDQSRLMIHSPKTEHHAGKATRVCPIFPELREYLDELDQITAPGTVYVLERLRHNSAKQCDWKATNLRTTFHKIIERAGLTPWPRLWHNMRASRQTELVEEFPAHVVSSWLGNTERVAEKHYLQVLDSHFEKAAQIPARTVRESTVLEAHGDTENKETPCFQGVSCGLMGDEGFEPPTSTV